MAIEPGGSLPYDAGEWCDALVLVSCGELVLETVAGRSWFFRAGDILSLAGLPVAALHNRGEGPVQLVATARDSEVQ